MRSSKSRSRNKNRNRPQGGGNIVNRVFDSSGPEGKVRGTPAQIIEKYSQLARDAQLSGDRVALENFQQHSEHYTRMLAAAQKEIDARQQQGNQNQQGNQQGNQNGGQQGGGNQQGNAGDGQQGGNQQGGNQPGGNQQGGNQQGGNRRRQRDDNRPPQSDGASEVIDTPASQSGPVETPEDRAETPAAETPAAEAPAPEAQDAAAKPPAPEKPKRTRTRKKAPAKSEKDGETSSEPVAES